MAVITELNRRPDPNAVTKRQANRRTAILLVLCGIAAFAALIAQLAKIMIREHDYYESAAVENQVRSTVVTASRGTIYDTQGKILAQSATVETIYISPVEMRKYEEDPELIARGLSDILDVDYDWVMKKWDHTDSWYETVMKKVEKELADEVRSFKNTNSLKSLHIIEDTKRYYPYASQAAQVIGFVGTDNYGLEGIEAVYDSVLEGENGRIVRATTARGTDMLYTGYEDYQDAVDGQSLELTIDNTIQYYLKKHMEQAVRDNKIRSGGMGIVMEVDTGAILGMCTLPDYDCNDYLTLNETYPAGGGQRGGRDDGGRTE